MRLSVLEQAKRQFVKGRYHEVIQLLEPNVIQYAPGHDTESSSYNAAFNKSFPFYLYLGLACLHTGDIGGAVDYLKCARRIKITDPDLLCAQAAIFLRKAETPRAIEYYLDAIEHNPHHKLARAGLDFIRTHNTPEAIGDALQKGEIKKFYPRPGVQEYIKKKLLITSVFFSVCVGLILVVMLIFTLPSMVKEQRADLSAIKLGAKEISRPIETGDTYRFLLSEKEVLSTYRNAQKYFQASRDNLAQMEVNRILSSNAAHSIKQKARMLMDYFSVPGFDTIKDIPAYADVKHDISLYLDCWVVWSGIPTNIKTDGQNSSFDLLVGYGERIQLEGIVPVFCDFSVTIDAERPIEVLGQIQQRGGVLFLIAGSIHQSKVPINRK